MSKGRLLPLPTNLQGLLIMTYANFAFYFTMISSIASKAEVDLLKAFTETCEIEEITLQDCHAS